MSETTKKPVLETMHLGISFGELHAVQDFNLSIYSGELVGLIGPNGAGKTTALHAISGLLRSASGSITLDGTDLQSVPANSIIRMGLAHVPEGRQLAGTLSGGEQQMLATGRALMTNPRIVLMDEPSMGLSPLLVKEIFAIIEELHKSGITILLVEQDAKMTLAVSDRAYVLETGTISMEGAASELAEDDRVRKAYLGA